MSRITLRQISFCVFSFILSAGALANPYEDPTQVPKDKPNFGKSNKFAAKPVPSGAVSLTLKLLYPPALVFGETNFEGPEALMREDTQTQSLAIWSKNPGFIALWTAETPSAQYVIELLKTEFVMIPAWNRSVRSGGAI